nr:MAG TPA: hypothetical protein [Caudoviricetes sp.]
MSPAVRMVTIRGIRYRLEDADALGLLTDPTALESGKEPGRVLSTGIANPENTEAPKPQDKDATPPSPKRRRPTAKE